MDAMVTARMPQGKKEAAASILRDLGTNPSQFINDVYDYVIAHRQLPIRQSRNLTSEQDIQAALLFIDSIPLEASSRFASLEDDAIRRERLIARGHLTESGSA